MRALAPFAVVCCLVAFATPDSGGAQDKKDKAQEKGKPDFAKLIVGKWEGTGDVKGFVLEFKDGKITETDTEAKDPKPRSGPYSIKGNTMTSTLGKSTQNQEIVSITDRELRFKRADGKELAYTRARK